MQDLAEVVDMPGSDRVADDGVGILLAVSPKTLATVLMMSQSVMKSLLEMGAHKSKVQSWRWARKRMNL
jgi:hypothetical protein